MARQMLGLVLILFVVSISIASVASISPSASPTVAASPIDNSVIGTLDGNVGSAALVGGPVPDGVFDPEKLGLSKFHHHCLKVVSHVKGRPSVGLLDLIELQTSQRSTKYVSSSQGFIFTEKFKLSVDQNCPNIEETFWRETNDDIGSSERLLDIDMRWLKEDLPVDIIDMPSIAQHLQNVAMKTSKEEDDFDDTDWDWMEADD